MMAYAYFTVHQQIGPWPIVNRGEPAVMNCLALQDVLEREGIEARV